ARMSKAVANLMEAQKQAMSIRPKVGGFPILAEVLRQAGVRRNLWQLPACQSTYWTELGAVVVQMPPLISEASEVGPFNQNALIAALRADQAGKTTFVEFLASAWRAGVVSYDVDFMKRIVTYFGINGESYVE